VAKLPLTVTQVNKKRANLFEVVVAYADGTTQVYLVPVNLATVEAVTISALAMGVLHDVATPFAGASGPSHRRFTPRT